MAVFVISVNAALSPVLSSLPVIRNYLVKVITKCIALKKKLSFRPGMCNIKVKEEILLLHRVNCSHSSHVGPNLHDVCVFSELELTPLALSLQVVSIWPITSTSALDCNHNNHHRPNNDYHRYQYPFKPVYHHDYEMLFCPKRNNYSPAAFFL
ncbi:hypothetical protein RRG08_041438 [Elysia crispata]|uniref:Uncharacterized protein n=1 Tax=Elysia crispata TaxID=231223 RepID=A0AAE0XMW6_9GAST|nr:hypothetical protein RRG08_041438 [Elysia crispata]